MTGKSQRCPLVTLTERKSRFELVGQVADRSAEGVSQAIITLLKPFKNKVRSITSDNGKEFAYHEKKHGHWTQNSILLILTHHGKRSLMKTSTDF